MEKDTSNFIQTCSAEDDNGNQCNELATVPMKEDEERGYCDKHAEELEAKIESTN